jgi:Flp pilus assembly protein TadG
MSTSGKHLSRDRRRSPRAETGQVLPLVVVGLVAMLGMAAFVVDIARIYHAQRTLQATADAAATAGAQDLPNSGTAINTAKAYSASPGAKNVQPQFTGVSTTASTKCVPNMECNPVNTLVVKEEANINTLFARILGINTVHITAKATAQMNGGTPQPFDVMIVIDRSGSMCQPCSKISNTKAGMLAFLGAMNPTIDKIGLTVFAPAFDTASRCNTPQSSYYDNSSRPYEIVPLSSDFRTSATGPINPSSNLVQTINCLKTGGITSYARAVDQARTALNNEGRSNAKDVIIFLSDGEANYGPTLYSNSSNYRKRPCQQAIDSAAVAKAEGDIVYTIGYDLDSSMHCKGRTTSSCDEGPAQEFSCNESPSKFAVPTLQAMATDGSTFFNSPQSESLAEIFKRVAEDLSGIRLVDNSLVPDDGT